MADIFRRSHVNIPEKEVVRYLGYRGNEPDENVKALISTCIAEMNELADFRACRIRVPVTVREDGVEIQGILFPGKALAKNLSGCKEVYAFAATAGPSADRRIAVLKYRKPAEALVLDAAASAAIEAFCDELNESWEDEALREGEFLRPRFSPGYGDLPLAVQKDLLRLLDAPHLIGLTLTDSCIMIPRKSVSALIGISGECGRKKKTGCASCAKKDCEYRRSV